MGDKGIMPKGKNRKKKKSHIRSNSKNIGNKISAS